MKIYIKNMVCDRCRFAVENVLQTMDMLIRNRVANVGLLALPSS